MFRKQTSRPLTRSTIRAAALWLAVHLAAGCTPADGRERARPERVVLFFSGQFEGQLTPCGCTTDPLGDLSRLVGYVRAERAGAVAYFDTGDLMASPPSPNTEGAVDEALRRRELLLRSLLPLNLLGVALGETDLARPLGPESAAGQDAAPWVATNLRRAEGSGERALPDRAIHQVGGLRVGLFGVLDPALARGRGTALQEPEMAARGAISSLRARGVDLLIGLAHMDRPSTRRLARAAPGADLLVVGHDLGEGSELAEEVGGTYIVEPGAKGQALVRLELHPRRGGPWRDAYGLHRANAEVARLDGELARLRQQLAQWGRRSDGEAAYVALKQGELTALERQRAGWKQRPLRVPPTGSYFLLQRVPIRLALPCDPATARAVAQLSREAQERAVERERRTLAARGGDAPSAYAGVDSCRGCHGAAVALWEGTPHARAWATLESVARQRDPECVGCHVVGFGRPGGASLLDHPELRRVQCEACHGPSARHVALGGLPQKDGVRGVTRAVAQEVCRGCHTRDHSDTFEYGAYLRDILGPGHGESQRLALGEGPTAHQLRRAALAKAGQMGNSGAVGRCDSPH